MTSPWMKRNGVFLALLLPALALALLLSSWRMVNLHLPMSWSRPLVAEGSAGIYEQNFLAFDGTIHHRRVGVEVLDVKEVPGFDGRRAVDGAQLWRVRLLLSAPPDELLDDECSIELVDGEGTRYTTRNSQEEDGSGPFHSSLLYTTCVPIDTPGPSYDPFSGELVEWPVERPGEWEIEVAIAVPDGITPEWVRIAWSQPEYLMLPARAR